MPLGLSDIQSLRYKGGFRPVKSSGKGDDSIYNYVMARQRKKQAQAEQREKMFEGLEPIYEYDLFRSDAGELGSALDEYEKRWYQVQSKPFDELTYEDQRNLARQRAQLQSKINRSQEDKEFVKELIKKASTQKDIELTPYIDDYVNASLEERTNWDYVNKPLIKRSRK